METDGELGWTSALWYWAENSHTRFAHYPGSDGGFGAVTQVRGRERGDVAGG